MCGIFGYVGPRAATPLILDGLRRLEYRGYDSAGLAVIQDNQIAVRRDAGKLCNLESLLAEQPTNGHIGVGHTRWATHGRPSRRNAHPHSDVTGQFIVVQNGIVENFIELRAQLQAEGFRFQSETDTEVIVHLIARYSAGGMDLAGAVRRALLDLRGPSSIVALSIREPDHLIVARLGNAGGAVVGHGDNEMFIASDIPALLPHTRRVLFLEDRQIALVHRDGCSVHDLGGNPCSATIHEISWEVEAAEKGAFQHFMQKEIHEQARAITDTLRGRVDFAEASVSLPELNLTPDAARRLHRLIIVACGTSAYAGMVGKFLIERLARLPVEVDYASEFRYRYPILDPDTLVLAITQSGETVDTLAALEEARTQRARTAAIVNVVGSQAARVCDGVIYMHVGPEIGVASTKAFTASLVDLFLLAFYLGCARDTISSAERQGLIQALGELPGHAGQLLDPSRAASQYASLAEAYHQYEHFLYLGRGVNYPIALEGALKLKEISYIHAEGYPAGEMKHGPIALIDGQMPVVAIAPRDSVYDHQNRNGHRGLYDRKGLYGKMISQIEQVKARGGQVIAVATEADESIRDKADHVLPIPATHELLTPVLTVLPLQLLAYHIAVRRGCDADQPRNLAKSVTVE